MVAVEILVTEGGECPFQAWFDALPARAADRVDTAVERRIQHGPGYRIYFGRDGETLIVLIGGGTKKGQRRDIRAAQRLWKEYKRRKRR